MWLVGVVIRRYIDILIIIINFPHSTCIRSFFGSSILTSLFISKCFFGLIYNIAIIAQFTCAPHEVKNRQCTVYVRAARSKKSPFGVLLLIGASLSETHTYRTAVQNSPYFYTYARPSGVQFSPAMGPFKRATRKRRTGQ